MQTDSFYSLDGKIYSAKENTISVNNRSFRYGDGFFETIKLENGKMKLKDLHFDRVLKSINLLKFQLAKHFSFQNLEKQITELAQKNKHQSLARIRVTFFRSDGGLYDIVNSQPHILIQTFYLSETLQTLNENGLVIGIFEQAQKSCDVFSNIKSNNYLQYAMAALWAKENKLNDALLFNTNGCIADSTIANIFIIKNNLIKTPSLQQGCVDGVMRRHIINMLKANKILVEECAVTKDDLINADEVFLSNAIKGLQWVKQVGNKIYENIQTKNVYKMLLQ